MPVRRAQAGRKEKWEVARGFRKLGDGKERGARDVGAIPCGCPSEVEGRGGSMSPTIFRKKGFRFLFFSREESRMHVHVHCVNGEAKYWLKPEIELAKNYRLSYRQLKQVEKIIKENYDELTRAWEKHFVDRNN